MVSIDLSLVLEKRLTTVVQESYHGDLQAAISAFLALHEKYGRKEQLRQDVAAIRNAVRQQGGITEKQINVAIKQHRAQVATNRV
ncbi:MAG: hypothetical protein DYG89_01255 [Caldilinea sp. CFX5]|nr:hypothetical protein [Caldilinea sp. CFX5]